VVGFDIPHAANGLLNRELAQGLLAMLGLQLLQLLALAGDDLFQSLFQVFGFCGGVTLARVRRN
jgi:hypothetical protein